MKPLVFILTIFLVSTSIAQKKKKKEDVEAILSMCGCHEITFDFAETFAPDTAYEFHKNYSAGGLEWIFPVSQEDDKIVIQHLLVVGDTMIIKHWRQDWLYENTDLYVYDVRDSWNYKELDASKVKGQWTQKVFQVDDSPRYEASGSWVNVDGRRYWETTADAPLPRREKTKRADYNVMVRRNRQELTDKGWVHEQDNLKVKRNSEGDKLIAQEKGWNEYTKTDESKCQVAKEWWMKNQAYWADVRSVWDEVFASQKTLKLKMRSGDQVLMFRLFGLSDELTKDGYDTATAKNKIREAIQMHINTEEIKIASN
ncbi:MAG: DUF6607 family protein [Bacteroidota bacterium]